MKKPYQVSQNELDQIESLDKEDLLKLLRNVLQQGVSLSFHGKRTAMEIYKRVRPRITKLVKELSVGPVEEQARNLLIEGENLQAMVTLYKYRGEVDLILTDPPYNTGKYFRYNDRWDEDPNDPDLGTLVTLEDGSRHTKWMKAMLPRLYMMKDMLKTSGVIAICIDDNELFHLGMMMDEVFGEQNRIAIINWQKSYAPKNDSRHVSTATEYVLVYAKDKNEAKTGLTARTEDMDAGYRNPDKDPEGAWIGDNPIGKDRRDQDRYAIQSPFTGALHYPGATRWRIPKKRLKTVLEEWGSEYIEKDINDGRTKALVIKDAVIPTVSSDQLRNLDDEPVVPIGGIIEDPLLTKARQNAENIRDNKPWPELFFNSNGYSRPRLKRHLKRVKKGKVPLTYWADEEYETPLELGTQSWDHEESGHSQTGINELSAVVGKGHNFDTVKPLLLFKKIIQIWCKPSGLVLDPYAGSGTTAHAVLELNQETEAQRRFIMIEQGRPDTGDKYARTLTWERIKRAITGERPTRGGIDVTATPLGGGFEFRQLTGRIDARAISQMKREELIDVVITSHFDAGKRKTSSLIRIEENKYQYLIGKNDQGEGYFVIWENKDSVGHLDEDMYDIVLKESKLAGLKAPHHVYARYQVYQSQNVRFYQIPDRILMHLGFNEFSDPYNNDQSEESND
ncbi:site-specific DNA-methyltransferase [Spirosoma aerophilum]